MSIVEKMRSLVEEIGSSHKTRVEGISQIRRETQAQVLELDEAHNAMAQELRGRLNRAEAARRQDEAQGARERAQLVAQRKSDVGDQLHELDGAHNAMAQELRAELAKVKPALDEAEVQREQAARQEIAQRKSDVGAQLQGHRVELAGARAAWQRMAALHGERAGISKAKLAAEEFSRLGERVFAGLADHSDGLRLTEIEREFGMSRFESTRVVKSLMDNGKVEKRDLSYYAT